MNDMVRYLNRRFVAIQRKHNFDPHIGADQVAAGRPDVLKDYGSFSELMNLAKSLKAKVDIPFDPSGLDPKLAVTKTQIHYVYFIRVMGKCIWKIGFSASPERRCADLQIGHDGVLTVYKKLPMTSEKNARRVERFIKRYLRYFKTRHFNQPKGETFNVPVGVILSIAKKLKNVGPAFLEGPPLKRK